MKRKELNNRIENGFSELAPNIFDGVMENIKMQESAELKIQPEEIRKTVAKWKIIRYAMYACAVFVIVFLCYIGISSQKKDSLYMVLDINPSIQIEMNKSYQVKCIKGLNDDGKSVIKGLKCRSFESVQELMDTLIEDVVDKSYLHENEGILVTLYTSDKVLYEDLENKLGECIDSKLKNMDIHKVTTAFYQENSGSASKGRKVLEKELTQNYGLDENQVEHMSVMEIIQYCKDKTVLNLNFYEPDNSIQEHVQNHEEKEKQTIDKYISESESDKESKDRSSEEKKDKEKDSEESISETIKEKNTETQENRQNEKESSKKEEPKETESKKKPTVKVKPSYQETTEKPSETEPKETEGGSVKENDIVNINNQYGDYYYNELYDNTIEITRYTGVKPVLQIPEMIDGKPVTKIGPEAFIHNMYIKTVVVPDSVKQIGENAFTNCKNLKRINLSNNITKIENHTFYGCSSLMNINIPDEVTSIGSYALYNCISLRRIRLPKSLTDISEYAFDNCDRLKNIYYDGNINYWNRIIVQDNNECLDNARVITGGVKIVGIKLITPSRDLKVGNSISIIAIKKPLNIVNIGLKWSSSDDSIATVNDEGVVTAVSKGKVKITAMADDDSGISGTVCLRVVD